jgi:Na+-driven multidrug efflux pump
MEAFGLALAGSLGSWVFIVPLALPYALGKSALKFSFKGFRWREVFTICKLGSPDALINVYFALRAFILNGMIIAAAGTMGLSAYDTVYTFAGVFWALPDGMAAVSRMLIGVSVGEEDRQTLVDIMRVMFRRYLPLMIAVIAVIVLCAEPLTNLYYHDPADPVYQMTLWGFRIFPWCLPVSIISTHFICYGNAMGKPVLVHAITISDGILAVLAFGAILLPVMQLNGAYLAYVLRGIASCAIIVLYAWICNHRFPRNLSDLMVIPRASASVPKRGST